VAGEVARDVIEDFRPAFLLLVGIAGGFANRDGTALGDVILADFVDYSELRKVVDGKSLPRHVAYDHPSIYLRENFAEPAGRSEWHRRIDLDRPAAGVPKLLVGHIVAGEKLWGDPSSAEQKALLDQYPKALAVEMEAMGFARAVSKARNSYDYNPSVPRTSWNLRSS
jgi:nucleoside phosphorylase